MLEDLKAATDAYRAAKAAVDDAQRAVAGARAEVPEARTRLHAAIVAAARAGVRQRDIVAITGYNRDRVRTICRAAGISASED